MADWKDMVQVLTLIVVTVGAIGIFVVIGQRAGNADNASEISKSLWTIYGVGVGMAVLLAFTNLLLIRANSSWKDTLVLLMVHVSFFMAYIAMGTSLMQILNH
jgi:hypothetical protein